MSIAQSAYILAADEVFPVVVGEPGELVLEETSQESWFSKRMSL